MSSDSRGGIPPRNPRTSDPRTLVDVDNPDDGELSGGNGGEGPEEEEIPEFDVPEIQLPDDGADILEDHGSTSLRKDRPFRSI
ncbi:MAG: hypothetical protein HPY55_02065 [Firmicutes bacterium]|nr:hypothetical protein [Bacillota bacterium]